MFEMSHEVLDNFREDYPGVFKGWDESRVRITIDECESENGKPGRAIGLFILFNTIGSSKRDQKHDENRVRSSEKREYKVHKVFLVDIHTEDTKVGGDELISEFYTLVDLGGE